MNEIITRNKQFLCDLFVGPFRGHGIIIRHPTVAESPLGDFHVSDRPVTEWLPWARENYAAQLKLLEGTGHDAVPFLYLAGTTGNFAAGFGCRICQFEGSNAAALPCVFSAEEADRLPQPDIWNMPTVVRWFELGRAIQDALGRDVPFSVPDIQSPFDIAAIVWNKEDLFAAMIENPEAVKRLTAKALALVQQFLRAAIREFPQLNICHCPLVWIPSYLGVALSEDEAGSMSAEMFEEFCLPSLIELSREFGGLFMHCCAKADHQYPSFRKIPNLRGLNRVFQYPPGHRPAFEMFGGQTVFMQAWMPEEKVYEYLADAPPGTRFLFQLDPQPTLDETYRLYERIRARCPRVG